MRSRLQGVIERRIREIAGGADSVRGLGIVRLPSSMRGREPRDGAGDERLASRHRGGRVGCTAEVIAGAQERLSGGIHLGSLSAHAGVPLTEGHTEVGAGKGRRTGAANCDIPPGGLRSPGLTRG